MEQLELKTVDPLSDAVAWSNANQEAYRQLILWAHDDISHGARPSIGLYAELLRRPHFANKLRLRRSDVSFLINNNLRADLARLLNRELDLGFPVRRARADEWEEKNA